MTDTLTLTRAEVEALRRCMAELADPNGSMVRDATPADRKALASVLGKLGVEPDGTLRTVNWCPPNTEGPFNGIAVPDALRLSWAGARSHADRPLPLSGHFKDCPHGLDGMSFCTCAKRRRPAGATTEKWP